jgi:hypothetical protein
MVRRGNVAPTWPMEPGWKGGQGDHGTSGSLGSRRGYPGDAYGDLLDLVARSASLPICGNGA